jgi:hypothetical protein
MNNFWKRNWPVVPLVVLVLGASAVSLAESYHGLRNWATAHGVNSGWTANAWPLQVDTFIVAGELGLLLSAFYLWPKKVRVLCWIITGVGLAVSVAANSFQELGPDADWTYHLTAAVPPIAAMAGLLVVLSITKQFAAPKPAPQAVLDGPVVTVEALEPEAAPLPQAPVQKALPKPSGSGAAHPKFPDALKLYRESVATPGRPLSERALSEAVGLKNRTLARFVIAYVKSGATDHG